MRKIESSAALCGAAMCLGVACLSFGIVKITSGSASSQSTPNHQSQFQTTEYLMYPRHPMAEALAKSEEHEKETLEHVKRLLHSRGRIQAGR